jgi:hypothetical protein
MPVLQRRAGLSIAAVIVVVGLAVAYLVNYAGTDRVVDATGQSGGPSFLAIDLRDGKNTVDRIELAAPEKSRTPTPASCLRFYEAGGTAVCLRVAGVGPTYSAEIRDRSGEIVRSVPLPGVPSRARVSASGSIVSWTSFVTGDSYSLPGGFSTRTGIFDIRSGTLIESIENFSATIEGDVFNARDVNYWGVTVAADDRTFYATLGTASRVWLVRGDLTRRSVESMRPNVECPSLSPDGTRVAFKKRVSRLGPWELHVVKLSDGEEIRLPGTAGIDDQAEWTNDDRLIFGSIPAGGGTTSLFIVPADGSAPAQLLVAGAMSPSVIR